MPVTRYFWDPLSDNILAEYDGEGNLLTQYTYEPTLHGPLISQCGPNGCTTYYHFDGQGSTRRLSDENEFLSEPLNYTAFGELLTPAPHLPPFLYIGELGYYFDSEIGYTYIRARSYAAWLGRWLCPDPAGFVDGPNVLEYVANNPVNGVDPSGLDYCCECRCTSLNIRKIGWRIFLHPGDPFQGRLAATVLSFVWLATANTEGDRLCRIATWVRRGKITVSRDGVVQTINPGVSRIDDGGCNLPSAFYGNDWYNGLNCKSAVGASGCSGKMCYWDAPGGIIEGWARPLLPSSGFKKPKQIMCVTIDLGFGVRCYGNFGHTMIEKWPVIQSTACVTFDAAGQVTALIADSLVSSPTAMEMNPMDLNKYYCP